MIEVIHLQRHPVVGNHSVERIFEDVRAAAGPEFVFKVVVSRHPAHATWGRIQDAWRARSERGRIRHILGDVHYLSWFLPRRGTILTVLDCVSLERMTGWKLALFKALWYTLPLRRAEKVTTISDFSRRSLHGWTGYPVENIAIIPPTLSDEFAASPPPPRGDRLRLLQIGTTENKNIERTIRALAGLPVHLTIIGELAPGHARLLGEFAIPYEQREQVSRAELLAQYRRTDAVLFASLYEGFGMPIIEAQAVGRPVITSDRCAMPEAAGGATLLVDPEDVASIASAVERLIDDPALCRSLVERGHANAESYRPAIIARRYEEVYRQVAGVERG